MRKIKITENKAVEIYKAIDPLIGNYIASRYSGSWAIFETKEEIINSLKPINTGDLLADIINTIFTVVYLDDL